MAALLACAVLVSRGRAEEPDDAAEARSTAVALNYCRASFHRILRYPSKRVLLEEQEKILNNLNLNGIADEEVVRLYTAVLLEISEVRIAERERVVIADASKRAFRRQLTFAAFGLGTQLATQQYVDAVRTGCNSWWDYRGVVGSRELEAWKVEKSRILAVTDKSSLFLDTFWKMARKRSLPDRWLIRGEDLDRLEAALQEPDPQVRLRVLQRMEQFMECYPPYWYYVGRTQQALGLWDAAVATYARLARRGDGHFRRDEMLAAGLANRAIIQDYLGQPDAADTARRALGYATGAWEVNLLCARVLQRHGHFAEAEDALLRNLDVDLEREQSLAALLSLYHGTGNRRALAARLAESETLRVIPLPLLVECAAVVGPDWLSPAVVQRLAASLSADFDLRFGTDDVVIALGPQWQAQSAQAVLTVGGTSFAQPTVVAGKAQTELRFRQVADVGSPLNPPTAPPPMTLVLHYPAMRPIQLHVWPGNSQGTEVRFIGLPDADLLPFVGPSNRYRVIAVDVGDVRLPLDPALAVQRTPAPTAPPMPVTPPVPASTTEPAMPAAPVLLLVPPPPPVSNELPPLD